MSGIKKFMRAKAKKIGKIIHEESVRRAQRGYNDGIYGQHYYLHDHDLTKAMTKTLEIDRPKDILN